MFLLPFTKFLLLVFWMKFLISGTSQKKLTNTNQCLNDISRILQITC